MANLVQWLERAAVAGALWWLVAGCGGPTTVDGRVAVRCPDETVRHVTVEYLRAHPACQLL